MYTADQAANGEKLFQAKCAQCHGTELGGATGPALKGEKFAGAKEKFVVSDIFIILSTQMPAGNPGTLSDDEYVSVMAFLLNQNGYHAGTKPLRFDEASSSETPLIYFSQ